MATFSSETYKSRRANLQKKVGSGILLFMGNEESPMNYTDNCYHFRQDSSFLYFFGIDQPGLNAIIDVDNDQEIIFGDELTINDVVWTGPQTTIAESATQVGISTTKPAKELSSFLKAAQSSGREVHYLPPYRDSNLLKISEWLNFSPKQVEPGVSSKLVKGVISLRSYKSAEEIEEVTKAVNLSRKLHIKALEMCHYGMMESRISSVLHEIVIGEGGQFAYPPIITVNGQTLHNHYYGNRLEKGQMLLVDAGAEVSSRYAGDITRTFAVDGKFTEQQSDIYSLVLNTEINAINNSIPGRTYAEVHHKAMVDIANGLKDLGLMKGDIDEAVTEGAHALFCPHGLGHMIGLDVHDMEDLGEDAVGYGEAKKRSNLFGTKALRLGRALEPGFVLTVEPGIYFISELIDIWKSENKFAQFIDYTALESYRNGGGIRIEDNILITNDGCEILGKPIPKSIDDIEETEG